MGDSKKSRLIKEQEDSGFFEDIGKAIISPFVASGEPDSLPIL